MDFDKDDKKIVPKIVPGLKVSNKEISPYGLPYYTLSAKDAESQEFLDFVSCSLGSQLWYYRSQEEFYYTGNVYKEKSPTKFTEKFINYKNEVFDKFCEYRMKKLCKENLSVFHDLSEMTEYEADEAERILQENMNPREDDREF